MTTQNDKGLETAGVYSGLPIECCDKLRQHIESSPDYILMGSFVEELSTVSNSFYWSRDCGIQIIHWPYSSTSIQREVRVKVAGKPMQREEIFRELETIVKKYNPINVKVWGRKRQDANGTNS